MSIKDSNSNDIEICLPSRAFYNKKGRLVFDPPVYRQRYGQIFSILLEEKWRSQLHKIVDFGCAEFGFFTFIKRLVSMKHLYLVDIDQNILKDNLFRLRPLNFDYLKKRKAPLTVEVLCGSASDPDVRLQDTDVVLAIELIEHLYPDILESLPYNVFSYIKPKLFIVTTPNEEFNVLFHKQGAHKRLRHCDHKFEWTREQFETWALNLSSRFPDYKVSFIGVGCGPLEMENYGHCSQMAIFVREDAGDRQCTCVEKLCGSQNDTKFLCMCSCQNCVPRISYGICTYYSCSKSALLENKHSDIGKYYEEIETIEYPYEIDQRSESEILLDNIKYKINSYMYTSSYYYNEDRDRVEIPLSVLIYDNAHNQLLSVPEVSTVLIGAGYRIEKCEIGPQIDEELCVICCDKESDSFSSESKEESDSELGVVYCTPSNLDSDWDS